MIVFIVNYVVKKSDLTPKLLLRESKTTFSQDSTSNVEYSVIKKGSNLDRPLSCRST